MQHYNIKPDGNNQIKCPFHEDDKPSCRIYADTNTFNCFGCNATGDQIEFIEKYEKCSKHEAILKAKQLCGIAEPINNQHKAKSTTIIGTEAVKEIAAELKQINQALQISVVETPKGEDVNSLAQGEDENEIFTHLLENRKPFSFSTEKEKAEPFTPQLQAA